MIKMGFLKMKSISLRKDDTKLLNSQQRKGFDDLGCRFQFYFTG